MKQSFLIIPVDEPEEAEKIRRMLAEKGILSSIFNSSNSDDPEKWPIVAMDPLLEYGQSELRNQLLNDSELWDQIPEPAKAKLLQFLNKFLMRYTILSEEFLPHLMFKQTPPPPPGFMKGIVTISVDFDDPLEDFKEYEQ